ncbi:MAG TPA: hypothetical protein VGV10_01670 [Thermoleophilaceae bacterium]|nr:hypothetical protein [Thermoleophilaceae bacterium]
MRRARVLFALLFACLLAPAAAHGAAYAPARGEVFHSGIGGYHAGAIDDFTAQSGKHPAVFQYFVSWRSGASDVRFLERLLQTSDRARSRAALAVSTKGTGLSPADLAAGEGDGFLLALNRVLAQHGRPTYLRLLSEMNNANNPYSAYTHSGRSRGSAFSTRMFKRAWRRAVLVVRGGDVAAINARLGRLCMAPVRTASAALATPPVAFMWVPLSFGNPEIARNHPRHWWPGSEYVDWVGTTWYSPFLAVRAFERFYRYRLWRNKPFTFSEYGVWGQESPRFLRLFFRFAAGHRRVQMISYYQSATLKPEFRLSTHPRSRSVLRRLLRHRRYVAFAPEYR